MPEKRQMNVPAIVDALKSSGTKMASALWEIRRDWQRSLQRRYSLWEEEREFVRGNHWGVIRGHSYQNLPKPRTRKVVRAKLNHCRVIVAQIAAIHTQERPVFDVMAGSSEARDSASAKVGSGLVKWMWRHYDIETRYRYLIEMAATNGTSYMEVLWDPAAGETTETTEEEFFTEIPEGVGEDGELEFVREKTVEITEGMPVFKTRTVTEVVPAPWATACHYGEAIFTHDDVSLSFIRDAYGVAVSKKVETGTEPDNAEEGIGYTSDSTHDLDDDYRDKLVRVYTCYVRKMRGHKRGKKIVFTKGVVLSDEDNPVYAAENETNGVPPENPFPVFAFRHYMTDDFLGDGVVRDIIPTQVQLNALVSKALTIVKAMAHPMLLVPPGFDRTMMDDFQRVVYYSAKYGPDSIRYLNGPQFPNELVQLAQMHIESMNTVAGISARTQGQAPGDDSGRKVQLLQERDFGRQAPTKATHDRVLAKVMLHALHLMRRHSQGDRIVTLIGENNRAEIIEFSSADLTTVSDVYVLNGTLSSDPTAKILQLSQALQAISVNPNMPAEAQSRIFELMTGYDNLLEIEKEVTSDRDNAKAENLAMYRGTLLPVEFWHNDLEHLALHYAEMNTDEWRFKYTALPGDGPEQQSEKQQARQVWEQHVGNHMQSMQQKQAPQQGAQPGQPQPGGGGATIAPAQAQSDPNIAAPTGLV